MQNVSISDYVVSNNVTIKDAIKKLDDLGRGIICIVDESFYLVGIVTDGDLRRAVYASIDLEATIMSIANTSPKTVFQTELSKDYLRKIFNKHNIRHIIVVDAENHLVGIEFRDGFSLQSKQTFNNPVVLMVGGVGSRLRPLTNDIPKPMLKVGEKPIIETILNQFTQYGFHDFYFCVNYLKDQIMDYFGDGSEFGVSIRYIEEDKPLGTIGAVSFLKGQVNKPFILMNGDILTRVDFASLMNSHINKKAAITVACREYSFEIPFGVVTHENYKVTGFVEKPYKMEYVNAGIYVINNDLIDLLPFNEFYNVTDLIDLVLKNNQTANVFPIVGYWRDIGRIEDYKKANEEYILVFE